MKGGLDVSRARQGHEREGGSERGVGRKQEQESEGSRLPGRCLPRCPPLCQSMKSLIPRLFFFFTSLPMISLVRAMRDVTSSETAGWKPLNSCEQGLFALPDKEKEPQNAGQLRLMLIPPQSVTFRLQRFFFQPRSYCCVVAKPLGLISMDPQ